MLKGGEKWYDKNNAGGQAKISYKKEQKNIRVVSYTLVFLNNPANIFMFAVFKYLICILVALSSAFRAKTK